MFKRRDDTVLRLKHYIGPGKHLFPVDLPHALCKSFDQLGLLSLW